MSTRSLTVFLDDVGREFVILYKQYDGFPIFYGRFLSRCLTDKAIVGKATPQDLARSIPKLAAEEYADEIEDCKEWDVDAFTLHERTTFEPHNWSERMADEWGVDYIYKISCYEDYRRKPMIQVFAVRSRREKEPLKSLFVGFGDEFFKWVESLNPRRQCAIGFDDDEDSYDKEGNLIGEWEIVNKPFAIHLDKKAENLAELEESLKIAYIEADCDFHYKVVKDDATGYDYHSYFLHAKYLSSLNTMKDWAKENYAFFEPLLP